MDYMLVIKGETYVYAIMLISTGGDLDEHKSTLGYAFLSMALPSLSHYGESNLV